MEEFVAVDDDVAGVGEAVLLRVGGEAREFIRARRALEQQTESACDFRAARCVFLDSRRDVLALTNGERVVQHRKGLHGRRRDAARRGGRAAVGAIERVHERIGHGAKDEAIDGATPGGGRIRIEMLVIKERRVSAGHEGGVAAREKLDCRRAAHREIEPAAEREQRVAHLFPGEARAILPP